MKSHEFSKTVATHACDDVIIEVIQERNRADSTLTRIYLKDGLGHVIASTIASTCGRTSLAQRLWFADVETRDRHGGTPIRRLEDASKAQGCLFIYMEELDKQAEALCLTHGFWKRSDLSAVIGPAMPSLLFKQLSYN